jgi:membrane protease YdiL (CAAX protease family)
MSAPRFHPLIRLVLCAFAVLLAQGVVATILISSRVLPMPVAGEPLSGRFVLLTTFAATPATLFVIALCRRWMDGRSFASLGLNTKNALPDFGLGIACGALAVAFIFGLLWVTGHLEVRGPSDAARSGSIAGPLMLWALAMLCVALTEEIAFRGYALHQLGVWLGIDKVGLGAAAIIQGIVFALVHLQNVGMNPTPENVGAAWQAMPNIALIGIFFALCYYKTGSLWFPIGFHAAWNFFLGNVFSMPVSGLQSFELYDVRVSSAQWLTGGSFGVEGSLLLTVLTGVMICVVRKSHDHPQAIADISALVPPDEQEEYVETGSRAPRLRERKEKRREQTITASGFEGWNDLAPERQPAYTTFKPPIPEAIAGPSEAVEATLTAPSQTVENAPAATEAQTTEFRPAVAAPSEPPAPIEPSTPVEKTAPEVPSPAMREPASTPPAPPQPTEQSPPPPVKKPPAPRW